MFITQHAISRWETTYNSPMCVSKPMEFLEQLTMGELRGLLLVTFFLPFERKKTIPSHRSNTDQKGEEPPGPKIQEVKLKFHKRLVILGYVSCVCCSHRPYFDKNCQSKVPVGLID